ncbi:hypothetical protein EYZ11_003739 [Aspergillus tanneri]|nr:hypothetical protein EYZ11_003739 [Aspergillus tanneri]
MDHEDRIQSLLVRLQQDIHRSGKKGSKQKELLVPEETLALLAGITDMAMKENIWYVHVHNGCKVHVLHPLESEGQYRKVLLSGSERVMELVCDRISHVRNLQELGDPLVDIRKPVVPIFPSMEALRNKNISPPLIRGVWDHYRATRNPAKLSTIRSLSKDLSTVREFAEHVDELTRSQPSRDAVLGYKEMPHRKQVAEALIALFNDDANSRLFSTAALNRALSWMCDYEFLHCTGTVLLRAEHVATVDTFNILLRSAAKRQDMGFFYRSLLVMLRMKIRPNDFTWLAYLDSAVAPKTKTDRMAWLIENGYITQTDAVRTALQMTIQDTFLAHLESGRSVDSFINMTIDSHGTNWFSPSLISQMFSVTSRLKDFSAMDRLLQICQQQGLTLDSSAVNQILLLFQSDIFSAIRYLFRCSEHPETMLKTEAWERLFLIAFKGRHYNICRVLWRYACIHKGMTWNMKRSVLLSLTRNVTRKKKKDLDNIWRTSAGKVIVGVDLHLPHYLGKSSVLENVPPEFHHSAVSYLASGFKTEGEERQKQLHLAKLLIQRDIQVGPWYRPTQSFSIMLEAAALMDQEWKGVPRPMQWLMQNAIQVPVQASNYPQ